MVNKDIFVPEHVTKGRVFSSVDSQQQSTD